MISKIRNDLRGGATRNVRSIAGMAMLLAIGALSFRPPPVAAAAEFSLDDLSFLVGHWSGSDEGSGFEEGWFAPQNGVMTGMFRWPSVGAPTGGRYVIELITIAEENGDVILRFKHFDPDMTAWEKDRPNSYRLISVMDGCVTFEGFGNSDRVPATMQYCREGVDTLIFRGAAKDQPLAETDFVLIFRMKED